MANRGQTELLASSLTRVQSGLPIEASAWLSYCKDWPRTALLWYPEVERLIEAVQSKFDFKHICDNSRVQNAGVPELAICFDEAIVSLLCKKYDLDASLAIHYGAR
jgi:hypothetical protein